MCKLHCKNLYISFSDVEKIQAGIGDKLVLFTGFISTFIAGFIIAFSISWKMALVMCSVLPLLVFMSATIAKVISCQKLVWIESGPEGGGNNV